MVNNETVQCACGCGRQFSRIDRKGRERKYVSGHNPYPLKQRIEVECRWCGKKMFVLECRIKQGCGKFCSRTCLAHWVGKKLSSDFEYVERQRQLIKAKGNRPPVLAGERHWNWKGGISQHSRGEDYRYIQWRKDVIAKYDFTCQLCGVRGGKLSAHHIKAWANHKDLRYDLNNGICYCHRCHMELHGLSKKAG